MGLGGALELGEPLGNHPLLEGLLHRRELGPEPRRRLAQGLGLAELFRHPLEPRPGLGEHLLLGGPELGLEGGELLAQHLPLLVPLEERLVALAPGGAGEHRLVPLAEGPQLVALLDPLDLADLVLLLGGEEVEVELEGLLLLDHHEQPLLGGGLDHRGLDQLQELAGELPGALELGPGEDPLLLGGLDLLDQRGEALDLAPPHLLDPLVEALELGDGPGLLDEPALELFLERLHHRPGLGGGLRVPLRPEPPDQPAEPLHLGPVDVEAEGLEGALQLGEPPLLLTAADQPGEQRLHLGPGLGRRHPPRELGVDDPLQDPLEVGCVQGLGRLSRPAQGLLEQRLGPLLQKRPQGLGQRGVATHCPIIAGVAARARAGGTPRSPRSGWRRPPRSRGG